MQFFQQKQRGMSIIEVIIAIVILLILALLITPSFVTYFNQNRLKGAAEVLYDNILLGRTNAIKQATTVTLTFVTGASWCYGLSSGAIACSCGSAASATNCNLGITSNTDYPNTSLAISGFTSSAITFDAIRAAVASGSTVGSATITSTTGTESITVAINALGTSSICSSTVGGYSGC